ncbi:MAG: bacillithiol biosynthesis BshC [Gemmatimonadota bacterium]
MRLHAAQSGEVLRHSAVETLLDEARVITQSLGGTPLARAAVEGRAPSGWYPHRPGSPNEWRSRAAHVQSRIDPRWFEHIAAAFVQREASDARLTNAVVNNGIVVTTGQQPGLFGGPVYTTAKALSALAMADAIEAVTGIPTAPVFWAATDDADFVEAATTCVVIDGVAHELHMPHDPGSDGRPMYALPLPNLDGALAQLEAASGSSPDARPISLVRRVYRGDGQRTVGSAFVEWAADLYGPLGISVLDAGHTAMREAAHDLLCRALKSAGSIEKAVAARDQAIRKAGYEPQVVGMAGRSLVFEIGSTKVRVPIDRAAAVAAGARPGDLSPNVLLRPIVEQHLLPTMAYMAGPGELAYFAQTSAVADALDLPAPLGVPRWSTAIVEPHVDRLADELDLELSDFQELHALQVRLAREVVPTAINEKLRNLRIAVDEGTAALQNAVGQSESVPVRGEVVEGARRSLQFRIDRLERRVLAAAKHTDQARQRRLTAAAASLYPAGKRQERAANILPFLARYGMRLLDVMRREAMRHAMLLVDGRPLT